MIVNQDWLVRNSQRRYPLDDSATSYLDSGDRMPEGFLVDANIWVPEYYYSMTEQLRYVYVSSASVTPGIVSVTLMGCANPNVPANGGDAAVAHDFVPLGAVSILRSEVVPYKNYPIDPQLSGVSGWIAFGPTVKVQEFSGLFSNPQQSLLAPKGVNFFTAPPVTSIAQDTGFAELTGDVTVSAEAPISVEERTVNVDGTHVPALVYNMELVQETLAAFAGPCGGRPESESCGRAPISSIAGVSPDCDGNITINFVDMIVRQYDTAGLCLDSEIELTSVCDALSSLPSADGVLPYTNTWERPCHITTPYTADFSDTDEVYNLLPVSGSWLINTLTGEYIGYAASDASSIAAPCLQSIPTDGSVASRTVAMTCAALLGQNAAGVFVSGRSPRMMIVAYHDAYSGAAKVVNYKSGEEELLATLPASPTGFTVTIENLKITVNGTEITIPADSPYWDPNGRLGVFIKGPGSAVITGFSVTDVPAP